MAAAIPLRVKMQLATVLAVVAFGLLNLFVVSRLQFATLRQEQERRVFFAGRLLASRLVEPLLYGDKLAVKKLLDETRSLDESFQAIVVADPSGAVTEESGYFALATSPRTRESSFPILDGRLGSVTLVVSLAPLEAQVAGTLRWLSAMVLAILVAGNGVALLLARSITCPVEKLVAFTRTFRLEGPVPPLPVGSKDELEELAHALTAMAERLTALHQQATLQAREMARLEHLATVGTLAAGVAHEINNPLAGVRTGLERMVRRLGDDEYAQRYAATLRDALARMERAVQGLLRFARATEVSLSAVALPEVVSQAWELVHPCWQGRKLHLETDLAPDLPPVVADRDKLREVFLNLFLNACDALEGRGKVAVAARREGHEVKVRVSDSGPGVPEELRERVFQPFFTTKRETGTGLGLAVSQAALREMGGDLVLLPEGPGAHFEMTLKVANP
ncbi:MAG: ATP-binding protein [Thermoanaerobaculum sp.]